MTICTKDRRCILGSVVGEGLAPPETYLSLVGSMIKEELFRLQGRFPSVSVDKYAIMPNHIHVVLQISTGGASPSPTSGVSLSTVLGAFKSLTTRRYDQLIGASGKTLWQRGYYDHIIRSEEDYQRIWKYIDDNPAKWIEDEYYSV